MYHKILGLYTLLLLKLRKKISELHKPYTCRYNYFFFVTVFVTVVFVVVFVDFVVCLDSRLAAFAAANMYPAAF